MRVVAALELSILSALRGPFLDARCGHFSFVTPVTLPACLDLTREGPTR